MRVVVAVAGLLFGLTLLPGPLPAHAADYPTKPIRMIVPWPPGGITDVIARGLGHAMTESMGQQVVQDNRPGAAGNLGVTLAAKSSPDGYTVLMTDVPSFAISATLYTHLGYDPVKDIEPIALPSRSPLVLVVNPGLGTKTVQQLVKYVKDRPGQVRFASSGPGSITHMTAERYMREVGLKMLHVPYKGGGPATAAVVGGEASVYFSCISAAIPHIQSGRLTLLALTSAKRSPLYPNTPTVAESTPGFEMGCNTGFFAPAGVPKSIVQRLYKEAMKGVQTPKMKELLAQNAAEPAPFTQPQFKAYVAKEIHDWGQVVRATGLKVD